ncbi:uncharacterized protein EDB93DRAFT_1248622 [Suillus bovinus]|uniref:uncharacterized protein n=1 Tax=Suillus bovinus TaxID=48563 RepID=UPI001B870A97|nr:uncharacterized protein EDB93DRAFT_1248622 [Suillus bovinus]KAG2153714.1 hypothetical protein EDB93DRAFT_1248622 [Suillus bovinus]
MKRGAERQISKDDGDDIEEVEDPGKGFQKADESVLTKRQIRGLPKRTMASNKASSFAGLPSAPLSPADSEPPAAPKFGGFTGFGSGAGPSPFSFTPPAVTSFATSNVAPSVSAATKGFALVVQAASTANASPSTSDEDYNAELNYYKSIRGLNVSFLSAIQKAVDQDPFIDIAGLLESYKNLRTTVQTELDSSSKGTNQKASASDPPALEKTAPSATGFPVPKGFSGFGSFGSPSLPPSCTNGTDKSSTSNSAFPFSTSTSSTNSTSSFIFGAKMSEDNPAPSPFGTSEAPKSAFSFGTKPNDAGSSSPSPFSFAPLAASAPASAPSKDKDKDDSKSSSAFGTSSGIPNFFASSKAASSTFSDLKPTSAFGTTTSLFGNSTDPKTPSFFIPGSSDLFNKVSGKTDTGNEEIKSTSTGLFGSSSFTPPTNAFASAATDKPTSAFGTFGGGSPPKGNGFTFGKAGGGSIGNPVGFGFGVAKPADGTSASSASAPTEFSFGAPSTSTKSVSPPTDTASRSGSQPVVSDEGTDDVKLLPTSNHDGEGEGEEDEETTYAVKAKVFKLSKTSDKSEWKELGIGMFRLKKHKETGARRALMRNSATGRIVINFRLFVSLTPTLMKTMVSFVGHDEGAPASFRIRVKTPELAQELKNALDREVAAVKESN